MKYDKIDYLVLKTSKDLDIPLPLTKEIVYSQFSTLALYINRPTQPRIVLPFLFSISIRRHTVYIVLRHLLSNYRKFRRESYLKKFQHLYPLRHYLYRTKYYATRKY